ncbi:MAG: type I-F CRISPR-associated protein Csy3 [Methylococcales bacterium]|nr:type I-F CRISPR-associated protein Csy3 [Methylococcales bacterium]
MTDKYKHPSTLAFTRSIEPSIFAFFSERSSDNDNPKTKLPVLVTLEALRGTISNYLKESDLANLLAKQADEKSEKNPRNANLQSVEKADLPIGFDTLIVEGHISFLANTATSCMSNDPSFMSIYQLYHQRFTELKGWEVLAERYVMNMVNGRWLWRNRTQVAQADNGSLTIHLRYKPADAESATHIVCDALKIPANQCLQISAIQDAKQREQLTVLRNHIATALSAKGEDAWKQGLRVNMSAKAVIGEGATVYPSQEFASNVDKGPDGREISKILAKRRISQDQYQAILHEQKVGNALRTIDTWYADDIGDARAIAAEPYGVVTTESAVYRDNKVGKDGKKARHFYDIIGKLNKELERLQENKQLTPDDYFFMSIIVRGGVLGGEGKKAIEKSTD